MLKECDQIEGENSSENEEDEISERSAQTDIVQEASHIDDDITSASRSDQQDFYNAESILVKMVQNGANLL